jgi:A/G-specific adenine glycosylase
VVDAVLQAAGVGNLKQFCSIIAMVLLRPSYFSRRLLGWYDVAHRDLPWRVRGVHPSPYHVLISEFMLQQTQVATVIPYFHRFLAQFPTLADLAAADEQAVLRHWQGLGYYARARNLLRCARQVVSEHNGELPADVAALETLAGIGRYTAGAIGSIAFGQRVPILDGNVTRVICRLDKIEADPKEPAVQEKLWDRAERILPRKRVSDFNSALMELGALICTPRAPQCPVCPVRMHCEGRAAGLAERIPVQQKKAKTPLLYRKTFCIRQGDHWLIEQRPANGRWARMWQFITRPADRAEPLPIKVSSPTPIGSVSHALTHRRYQFEVFACETGRKTSRSTPDAMRWVTLAELEQYPLPHPHVLIADMLSRLKGNRCILKSNLLSKQRVGENRVKVGSARRVVRRRTS